MKKKLYCFFSLFFFLSSLYFFGFRDDILAIDCIDTKPPDGLTDNQKGQYWIDIQDICNQKIIESQKQQQTLKVTLIAINSKINLVTAQINQTLNEINTLEGEIITLSKVVTGLDQDLNKLAAIYVARVRESYKRRDPNPLELILTTNTFNDYLTRLHYLNVIKSKDQQTLATITSTKIGYDMQKKSKIEKQKQVAQLKAQLLIQKSNLDIQKKSKNELLIATRNNELIFQKLLNDALGESQAIQNVIAGKGTEVEVGRIEAGKKIASIIQIPSVCSSGAHVHFEIYKNNNRQNPASYLIQQSNINWNMCDRSGLCDDPFPFTGSYDWPIKQTIYMTQGYGLTSHALHDGKKENSYCAYGEVKPGTCAPHTGLDMASTDSVVNAVKDGILYQGSLQVDSGCDITGTLRYVKVVHDEGLVSYYFHVNYF